MRKVVAVARGEAPDRTLCRMSPVVERDNPPVADLDDVIEACPDLTVSVTGAESAVNFFCPRARGEDAWGHHEVGPCVGINHSSVTLSAEGCTDISVMAGENDAPYEGTALRHVAELDVEAPSLDAGWDLALANLPVLAPFLSAEPLSGGALDVFVEVRLDAEAACERVEPFDQRGLRLAGWRARGAQPPGWRGCTGPSAGVFAHSSSSEYVGA